ncbi:MAG: Ig-like domain-containing protein [Verrucomicrobiota bacterium]
MKTNFLFRYILFFAFANAIIAPGPLAAQTSDLPTVTLQAIDAVATETPGNTGRFLFTRYGTLSNSLTANFSIGAAASNGVDYAAIPESVTFPEGSSNVFLTIEPIDDLVPESNEGVALTLRSNAAYRIESSGTTPTAVVVIYDDDNLPPSVSLFNPANHSTFTLPTNILLQAEAADRDGWLRRVEFYRGTTLIGSVAGQDVGRVYNFTWTNPPPGEFVLTARALDNFERRATSAPVNIVIIGTSNVVPVVSIVASDSSASEPGENKGTFKIYRSNTTGPLTVFYTIAGSAANGVDYFYVPESITIPAGLSHAEIVISPLDDTVVEGSETVLLTLKSNSAYRLESPTSAMVTIEDNEFVNSPPSVRIFQPTNGAVFISPADITIFAEAFDSNGFVATVEFFAGTNSLGIATNNPASGSPVNPFHIVWTNVSVGEYTLTARATDNSGLSRTSEPVHISVIEKPHDVPVITIRATDPNAAENPALSTIPLNPGVFSVTRNPASSQALAVNYAIEGTAANGVDYDKLSGTVTIPPNEPSANIYVVPIDDTLVEGTETVVLILRTSTAYALGDARYATVFLEDNDRTTNPPPSVHLTWPTNHAVFVAPATIPVRAEATDNGQVARVDFFVGDKLIGSDTNAPYEISWAEVGPGYYALRAKATDNDGASSFSSTAEITVRSPNEIAFVKRQLPRWYVPSVKLLVSLRVEPLFATTSYSILDRPPTNWLVGAISEGGSYDPITQSVSFGPFTDHVARTLTYEVTPPANESGEKHFTGNAMANGITTPIGGNNFILPAPAHPADNDPPNFSLTEQEVGRYVTAWKNCDRWPISPDPIPISYVTRAGYLFARGGEYRVSTHYPTPFPPLLWVPVGPIPGADESGGETPWTHDGPGSAVSAMPTNYVPGVPFTVTISIAASSNVLAYALEDRPPEGWGVTTVSDGGVFCPMTHKIRWGLFSNHDARVITYQVLPRTTSAVGEAHFSGVASFNGINLPITGQRTVRSAPAPTTSPAKLQSITGLPGGDRLMTFEGEVGGSYRIEATTNFFDWMPLEELLNNDGALQYIDGASEGLEQRFYRVVPID